MIRRGGAAAAGDIGEDPLPPEVKGANFDSLQTMISREIKQSEASATMLEADVPLDSGDDAELRRHREAVKQRRAAEAEAREKERDKARRARRKADEDRQRQMEEQMRREEDEQRQLKEAELRNEQLCHQEFDAATRIQAHVRGTRSRRGSGTESPAFALGETVVHKRPVSATKLGSSAATPEPDLLA